MESEMNIYKLEVTRSVPFEGEYTIDKFKVLYFKDLNKSFVKFVEYVNMVKEEYEYFKLTIDEVGYCLFEDGCGGSICVCVSAHELL